MFSCAIFLSNVKVKVIEVEYGFDPYMNHISPNVIFGDDRMMTVIERGWDVLIAA